MSAMSARVACTNFGGCALADKDEASRPTFSADQVACPYCSKALASPHRVSIGAIPAVGEDETIAVSVKVSIGGACRRGGSVSLRVDGSPSGEPKIVPDNAKGEQSLTFTAEPLDAGTHVIQAVLTTDDGRVTSSNEQLLFISRPSNVFGLLMWALLLILLLCLSATLGWFGKPLFGQSPNMWLTGAADLIAVLSALLIGGLLINLGLRERSLGDEREVRPQLLSGSFPRSDSILNRTGQTVSSWRALIIIGALPFCFATGHLISSLFGGKKAWGPLTAVIAIAIIVAVVLWDQQLARLAGPVVSRAKGALSKARAPAVEPAPAAAPDPVQDPSISASPSNPPPERSNS